MTSLSKPLREIGYTWHLLISKSKLLSYIYICFLVLIIKPFGIKPIKQRILNSINTIKWKGIDLPSQTLNFEKNINFKIFPHFHEFDFQSLLFKELSYEKEVFRFLSQIISRYDSIIEIGANVGVFTLFFYQEMLSSGKEPRIYAFEPSKTAYRRLVKNLELNNAMAVETYNCAIGDRIGFLEFFEPENHLTNGSLSFQFASVFSSNLISSKALVVNGNLLSDLVSVDDKTLVKIDVEGFESEVLSSMTEFIEYCNPTMIIEVLSDYEDKLNALSFLSEKYDLYNITEIGLVPHEQFQATEFRDYVLFPKQSVKELKHTLYLES